MDLRSGMRLNESTQKSWTELVEAHDKQTDIRLRQPFVLTCIVGDKEVSITIPAGTEVMLFCNVTGSYKQASPGVKLRTHGTFFIKGAQQISVMNDWSIKVTNPRRQPVMRSGLEPARHPRESLLVVARW